MGPVLTEFFDIALDVCYEKVLLELMQTFTRDIAHKKGLAEAFKLICQDKVKKIFFFIKSRVDFYPFVMVVTCKERRDLLVERKVVQVSAPLHYVFGRTLSHVTIRQIVQGLWITACLLNSQQLKKKLIQNRFQLTCAISQILRSFSWQSTIEPHSL